MNWDKPIHGNYGLRSSGMFGLLPSYLQTMGYDVRIDSTLQENTLQDMGVIVMINLNEKISEAEKRNVQEFVYGGGALLALGDHTGLGGIREPLNDLLDFVDIRFRFDSAHYLKDQWRNAFDFLPGTIFTGVKDENDVGISVGASLDFSPGRAVPILFAKYGFSDWGNPLNRDNAYLGDRLYNPGELLGDIVLVAAAHYGRGKVLVFGDTSTFQNGTLVRVFPFVGNVFRYLTEDSPGWLRPDRRWMALALILLAFILLFGFGKAMHNSTATLLLSMVMGLSFAIFTRKTEDEPRLMYDNQRLVYIDAAHLNRFSHYGEDGIWALCYNLMRNDYLPFVFTKFSPEALSESEMAFFIAPAKRFNREEIKKISQYMQEGGIVIWSVGYEEKSASASLLATFGLDLDNRPLGAVPSRETSNGIKFYEAWPVLCEKGVDIDTLSTGWGYPVIVSQNIGKGKFILIGDSGFLLSENIEQDDTYIKPNVEFLKSFLESFKEKQLTEIALKSRK